MPSTKSSAKIMFDLAQELVSLGHEVTVITVSEFIKNSYEETYENGVKVLRFKSGKIDGANKYLRFLNEWALSTVIWLRGKRFFKNNSCELIIWYSPSIFFSTLINKIKLLNNCKSYLILRDIFPQWAVDTGVLKNSIILKFLRIYEFKQYASANVIGVQSPNNLLYFNKVNLHNKFNVEVLYNWTNLEDVVSIKTNFRDKLGLKGKVVFFYGGNIGVAQDMDNIVRLAYNLRSENKAYFLIVGDGTESKRLTKLISELKINNIMIHSSVDQNTYHSMISEFDVGIISLDKKFKTPNFPGKMLGYMNFSKPIIASINEGNDLKDILTEYNAGLVSINGDDLTLINNCKNLLYNYDLRVKLGKNGKKMLTDVFSVSNASNQILSKF